MFLCCYNKLMSTKIMFLLHISKRGNLIGHNMLLGRICLVNECFVYSPVDNKMSG